MMSHDNEIREHDKEIRGVLSEARDISGLLRQTEQRARGEECQSSLKPHCGSSGGTQNFLYRARIGTAK